MVPLLLGRLSHLLRERERAGEVVERKRPAQPLDALDIDQLPVGDLRVELGDLLVGDRRRIAPACDALLRCQAFHGRDLYQNREVRPTPPARPNREELIALVERIMRAEGATEQEADALIDLFEASVPHPAAGDLIFHPEHALGEAYPGRELTAAEVVDLALSYRPIAL
jgi:hypothetical protein